MTKNFEKLVGAEIKRESEKAVLINVRYGDEFKKDVWFPRSQIEIREDGIWATSWIIDQKAERCASGYVCDIETERTVSPEVAAMAAKIPAAF